MRGNIAFIEAFRIRVMRPAKEFYDRMMCCPVDKPAPKLDEKAAISLIHDIESNLKLELTALLEEASGNTLAPVLEQIAVLSLTPSDRRALEEALSATRLLIVVEKRELMNWELAVQKFLSGFNYLAPETMGEHGIKLHIGVLERLKTLREIAILKEKEHSTRTIEMVYTPDDKEGAETFPAGSLEITADDEGKNDST